MPHSSFAVKPDAFLSATCETFGIGLGFKLLNMPCSGLYPFSIKRCSTTQEPNVLQSEVRRLQKVIESTQASPCETKFREMCSRVTSKLSAFQPLKLVNSNAPNASRSQAHGIYMVQDILALCCHPLSECEDDDGCASHTPYNVQECCSNCESTYQKCYEHLNDDSGDSILPHRVLLSLSLTMLCN